MNAFLRSAYDEIERFKKANANAMTKDEFELFDTILTQMMQIFSEQGHSGCSANYALTRINRLIHGKPLKPITADDFILKADSKGIKTHPIYSQMIYDTNTGMAYDKEYTLLCDPLRKIFWFNDSMSRKKVMLPYNMKLEPDVFYVEWNNHSKELNHTVFSIEDDIYTMAFEQVMTIGGREEIDEMQEHMNENILSMVNCFSFIFADVFSRKWSNRWMDLNSKVFSDAANVYFPFLVAEASIKLARFEPLTPLTGDDDEFNDVSYEDGKTLYQNKRASNIFKKENESAYTLDGRIFSDNGGITWFTNKDSKKTIKFPYIPKYPEEVYIEYHDSSGESYDIITDDEERIKNLHDRKRAEMDG